jgi:hypothetical protein
MAGAGRFRGARDHAARGKDGLGADVGAEALGPAVAVVPRQSCPVGRRRGPAWPRARRRAWVRAGTVPNFEWLCSNTIFSNFFQLKRAE